MAIPELNLIELNRALDELEAAQACRNLIGCFSYYQSAFRNRELLALWSNREDVALHCCAGSFIGQTALRQYFLGLQGDRDDPGVAAQIQGVLLLHELDTEVLEVAMDAGTAHGVWFSPGNETRLADASGNERPDTSRGTAELEARCYWTWDKVEADFILEDGIWKIWHITISPIFKTRFEVPWTQSPIEAPADFWRWSPDAIFPAQQV